MSEKEFEMVFSSEQIILNEEDLKEIFSLFSSSTRYEKEQAFDESSDNYFLKIELFDEYSLTEEKREFALDAWRAVVHFLYLRGYSICRDEKRNDLSFSIDEFIA